MRTKILFGALSNGCSLEPTETPIMSSCHLHHGRTASGCRCTSSHQSCSERVWDRFHPGLETVGDHSQCDHHEPERHGDSDNHSVSLRILSRHVHALVVLQLHS